MIRTLGQAFIVSTFIVFLYSCQNTKEDQAPPTQSLLEKLSPEETGLTFINEILEDEQVNLITFSYVYNGAGIGIGDFNNDGLPDIYLAGNSKSSRLYLNKGDWKFEDITEAAGVQTEGWSTGVSVVDINQDGFADIYVCRSGPLGEELRKNLLFVNNGDGTFTEEAAAYRLDDSSWSTQGVFFDYDKDGDLDMFLLNYDNDESYDLSIVNPKINDGSAVSTDKLFRNNGDGTFSDISKAAGITYEGYGLGVALSDINADGWTDIFVSNDFIFDDLLYINNGNGTFTEKSKDYLLHTSHFGMGTDAADFNNDGLPDIMQVDMMPEDNFRQKKLLGPMHYDFFNLTLKEGYSPQYMRNNLHLNNAKGAFSEIGYLAGVHHTDWSWAPLFVDLDADGHKDLLVSNGYRRNVTDFDFRLYMAEQLRESGKEFDQETAFKVVQQTDDTPVANYAFHNEGNYRFTNKAEEWGFAQPSYSAGMVYADFDGDGAMDVLVSTIDEPLLMYRNKKADEENFHYLKFQLRGQEGNTDGLGTKIFVYSGGQMQFLEANPFRGYMSSVDPILHTGLGSHNQADSIRIIWTDGKTQKLENVPSNQTLTLRYSDAKNAFSGSYLPKMNQRFSSTALPASLSLVHEQDEYADFKQEPLLPHQFSKLGPGVAVYDINEDGKDDFVMGQGLGYTTKVFLSQEDDHFKELALRGSDFYDDHGLLVFRPSEESPVMLYVASGGNQNLANHGSYRDRLYSFDAERGTFEEKTDLLPDIRTSSSIVRAGDLNNDGNIELFVGTRLLPMNYPKSDKSHLLSWNGDRFEDISLAWLPGGNQFGMVTDAAFSDYNNDGRKDLLIVGEFMAPVMLENTGLGTLQDKSAALGLDTLSGWYTSLQVGDFDNNGFSDYVLGNYGMNSRLKASTKEPVRVYATDLDKSGNLDPIISYYIQGQESPLPSLSSLTEQVVAMRRKFPKYNTYARATVEEIMGETNMQQAIKLEATHFQSTILLNGSNGFTVQPLPVEAQFAPIKGMMALDLNEDSNLDMLLIGNNHETEVVTGRHDAMNGLTLLGQGDGTFKVERGSDNGFLFQENARSLVHALINDKLNFIASANGRKVQAFELAQSEAYILEELSHMNDVMVIEWPNGLKRKVEYAQIQGYYGHSSSRIILSSSLSGVQINSFK